MDIIGLREQSLQQLESLGLGETGSIILQSVFSLVLLILLAWLSAYLGKKILYYVIPKFTQKTKNSWDDKLLDEKFIAILSYYLFGGIFFCFDAFIASESIRWFTKNITGTYFVVVSILLINKILDIIYEFYKARNPKEKGNLKIYIQLAKVIIYSLGVLIIISFFANRNFIDILKGLGAMITILLIVYKDTILGFVAGISLSANKMLEVGDWISVPQCKADGTVLEIGLNTVKVQNWDKTISTIPPYKLISESFINWKGMETSGGRRVKRSINIDIDSIHFLSEDDICHFEEFSLIKDYIQEKKEEIAKDNQHESKHFNQHRLTNVGTFKKYIENYLKAKGIARENMTFLVRQLQSTAKGLPIEIYFFSKVQAWAEYEGIQADIFDHIFAMAQEFGLRVYQDASAYAVASLKKQ